MECKKGKCIKKGFKYITLCLLFLLVPFALERNVYGVETVELEQATVVNWVGAIYTQEELEAYDARYKLNVKPAQITSNNTPWNGRVIDYALDDDWSQGQWEVNDPDNENHKTYLEVDFGETVEIGQLVYRVRQDMQRGFPLEFKIQIATEEDGEFKDAVEGSAGFTNSLIAIKFETKECRKLRFVWEKVEDSYPSASVFYCYKNDGWEAGQAEVGNWPIAYSSEEERAAYNEQYFLEPTQITSNKGAYPGSPVENAGDQDWKSHFEANSSDGKGTYLEVAFSEIQEVGQVIYSSRQDADGKGFPLKFKVQASKEESGENFVDIATGSASPTLELIKISFEKTKCRRLRFVWEEAYNGWPSCSVLYCYKEDNLKEELRDLFADGAATALKSTVSQEDISLLTQRAEQYPAKESLWSYIEVANALISGDAFPERIHEPITLSQLGDRIKEKERTALTLSLSNWDLTGYYVRPGDVIEVFVEADPQGPMPRLVLGEVARKYDSWQFGYDGMLLENGLNYIRVPDTMKGCQVIYFYNPALPEDQAYAPLVRLCGGNKYPVYFYDSNDSLELAKAKEEAFIREVTEYCEKVNNNMNEAALGDGEPNICEYVSDKIQIATSAKAVLANLDSGYVWKQGRYREWAEENVPKHGIVERDESNQVTGIRYQGPAAVMEAYEMLFADMQLYCGFNITDPSHEDYRNHGKFVLRAYNDGWGEGWAQQCYSGYNLGSVDWESPMATGWYSNLVVPDSVLTGGWTVYHEIGHQFDSIEIGTSESTNNLFGLSAQQKYRTQTRMEDDNRWYNHFTNYVNTGILPYDDLLFYPGAVILQLDGVNFAGKSIYTETDISNYGRACRYARLHKEELEHLSKNDKLVVSFSMACGVDLSSHFAYYGREVSEDAKVILSGLPKETRPTWLVTERTFRGGAFSETDKNKVPEIASIEVDENNGTVNITMKSDVFTEENIQCFAIYRQKKVNGNLVGNVEWVGVTGDNLTTKNVNEVYQFTDRNAIPGVTYEYSVGVYDCTLIENEGKATVEVAIPLNAEVPITSMQINNNDKAVTVAAGTTYKVRAEYFPINATVDLTQMRWWAEGYGDDKEKTGAGADCLLILPDPEYPSDPTRKIIKGVQPGQTTLYVSIGDIRQNLRIIVNNNMAVEDSEDTKYTYEFKNNPNTFKTGETYHLNLYRTTCDAQGTPTSEVIRVVNTPNTVTWESSAPEIVAVTNKGQITVLGIGEQGAEEVTISFKVRDNVKATYTLTVVAEEVALEQIVFSDEDKDGISMKVGENRKIIYNLLPANTTESRVAVISSDNSCVRVENDGTITAVAGGTANITVSIGEISATLQVEVESYIPLKGIMLDKMEMTLNGTGATESLSVIKIPEDATVSTENTVWTSANESIFTVENGVVTAVGTGTADLIVSLEGKTTTIPVTVAGADIVLNGIGFKGVAIGENTELVLKAGKTHQLVLMVDPVDATALSSTQWRSSNEEVATVSYGYIRALSKGQTIITATLIQNEGTEKEIRCEVSCTVNVESADVILEGMGISHKLVNLNVGDNLQISTSLRPVNANVTADGKTLEPVVWTVEDETIATVDATGMVTAKKGGTTNVMATGNGFSVSCQITVDDSNLVEAIFLDKESLTLELGEDQEAQLSCTIQPGNITAVPVWKSSNPSVVEVNQKGKITVHKEGIAVITVSLGGKRASCEVTVTGEEREVCFDSAGGENVASQTVKGGTRVEKPADPKKTGYIFFGWYLVDAQGTMADTAYDFAREVVTEDITLKAKWQVKPPTANYTSGSEVDKNTAIVLNSGVGATIYYTLDGSVPTKESTEYEAPIVVTAPIMVKAIAVEEGCENSEVVTFEYTIRKLTVTFDVDGAAVAIDTQRLNEGEKAQKPADPTKDGYLFRGWYLTDEQGVLADTAYDFTTAVVKDIVLTAKWEAVIVVPQINGYTQVTSLDLDPEKEYMIVSVDSDNVVYGLYGNSNGLTVSPGSLTGSNGAVAAVLTNLDSKPTATYLKDGSPIDMEQLHIKVAGQGNSYSFYFTDHATAERYYLHLGESDMFSTTESFMTVSVTNGSYKITRNNRMLYLNVRGDAKSDYSGHITDFWGPRPADNKNFKIYLFEKIEEDLSGYTLSLEGTIGVNFCMDLGEEVIADTGAYMNFTLNGKEYLEVPVGEATIAEKGGTTCYVFKCGVPVKDMETEITAQIILSDGRKGAVYTYTVKEYVDYIFENKENYAEELALVEAMSNFGDYATAYFGDDKIDATPEMKAVTSAELESYRCEISENSIYYGSSLLLKSDIVLRHYFTEEVTVVEKGYKIGQKGSLWYVEAEGIPAHELGISKTITVTTKAGVNITIAYNPLSYAYIALSRDGVDEELKSVMRAMYLYHQAAGDYLVEKTNN